MAPNGKCCAGCVEECLREAKVNRIINGGDVDGGAEESELAKQWRVQMMDDLDDLTS